MGQEMIITITGSVLSYFIFVMQDCQNKNGYKTEKIDFVNVKNIRYCSNSPKSNDVDTRIIVK